MFSFLKRYYASRKLFLLFDSQKIKEVFILPAAGHSTQNTNGRQIGFTMKVKILQTKINMECSYIVIELSSNSKGCVLSENISSFFSPGTF